MLPGKGYSGAPVSNPSQLQVYTQDMDSKQIEKVNFEHHKGQEKCKKA
jgi:hypothetical protein